jgi:amidase
MKRIVVVASVTFLAFVLLLAGQEKRDPFSVVEATIPEMRTAMEQKRVTSRELVTQYLTRIAMYEHVLNAVMTVNPHALEEADERDWERAQGKIRGPLHGIPIAVKDNIQTTNMPTTGGVLAFDGFIPPYEATLVKNLREAGAIIIAKTTLAELASWATGNGGGGNYNAIRGSAVNPYDPRRDPREGTNDGRPVLNTGGSSSGGGTAANFWAANVGTDTTGSILGPANQNMLVGIKPTVGRISRYGVIPVTADEDTAGPMARTVTDAAILLGAMEGGRPDPNDAMTNRCPPPAGKDYTRFLNPSGLKGARIGIPRAFYYEPVLPPGATAPRGGLNPEQARVMTEAISILQKQGAMIVDPVEIPSVVSPDPERNFLLFNYCFGAGELKGHDDHCSYALKYGFLRDFNKWLATLGPSAPVKTLTELRQWNLSHANAGAIRFGQLRLDMSDELNLEKDRARFEADRAKDLSFAVLNGIDAAIKTNRLDALLFPGASSGAISAPPGYPTVIVPFGMIPNAPAPPLPEGFNAKPAPYGVSFTGLACTEPRLLELSYGFEQATKRRISPPLFR